MSLYRSQPDEVWTLRAAVDALAASARRAGRPGWIWIAGIAYPFFLVYGWELIFPLFDLSGGREVDYGGSLPDFIQVFGEDIDAGEAVIFSILLLILTLPGYRLSAGLARLTSPGSWVEASNANGHPGIRSVWRAGNGLTLSSCGLQIQVALMFVLAIVLCAGPAVFVMNHVGIRGDIATVVLASPVLILLAIYGAVLSSLIQLALHSLAQNHRGVASAMVHAWRLLRRDAWSTGRTMAVDGILILAVASGMGALYAIGEITCMYPITWFAQMLLLGFAGVARAGYWAHAYRALGGLSPDDGIPGLAKEPA